MTSVEYLFNELWETPKDKLTWHSILDKAKEMNYKELMNSMQTGMELQEKKNNRVGFRERNGLLPQQNLPKEENKTSFGEISDEEIEKARYEAFLKIDERGDFFSMGAKWYREQLKSKQ
jgi:hypothetical protein